MTLKWLYLPLKWQIYIVECFSRHFVLPITPKTFTKITYTLRRLSGKDAHHSSPRKYLKFHYINIKYKIAKSMFL